LTAVAFDTLKFAQTLRDKGRVPQDQAEGIAQAFADALADEMVTKTYLDGRLEATKADINTRIEATKADILKWMFGTMGFQTIVILGAVLALNRFSH
jgi:hypothetical protein